MLIRAAIIRPLDGRGPICQRLTGDIQYLACTAVLQFIITTTYMDELPLLAGPATIIPLFNDSPVVRETILHAN